MAISSPITSSNFEHSAIILALRLVAKCFNTIQSSVGDAFLKAAHEIEPSRGEEEMLNAFRKLSLTIRTPRGPAVSLDKRSKTCRSLAGNNKSTARVSRSSGLISSITAPTNHGPTKEATVGRRSHGNIPVTIIPPIDHSRTGEAVDHSPTDGAPVGRQMGQTQSYDSDPLRNASNAQLEKQSDISSGSITGETAVSRLEALIKDHKPVKTSLTKGAIDRLVKIVRKMSIQNLPETTMPHMRPPESVKELWEQYKQFDRQCMERRRVFQMALTYCWVREIERRPTRTDNEKILEEIALNVGIPKEDTKEMYGLYACGVTLLSLQPRVWIMTAGMKLDSYFTRLSAEATTVLHKYIDTYWGNSVELDRTVVERVREIVPIIPEFDSCASTYYKQALARSPLPLTIKERHGHSTMSPTTISSRQSSARPYSSNLSASTFSGADSNSVDHYDHKNAGSRKRWISEGQDQQKRKRLLANQDTPIILEHTTTSPQSSNGLIPEVIANDPTILATTPSQISPEVLDRNQAQQATNLGLTTDSDMREDVIIQNNSLVLRDNYNHFPSLDGFGQSFTAMTQDVSFVFPPDRFDQLDGFGQNFTANIDGFGYPMPVS